LHYFLYSFILIIELISFRW